MQAKRLCIRRILIAGSMIERMLACMHADKGVLRGNCKVVGKDIGAESPKRWVGQDPHYS
jgi:hypothetical protein